MDARGTGTGTGTGTDAIVARLRAAGCVFAEDEAQLFVAEAHDAEELERFLARRVAGEPVEYILGWAQFRGLRVVVAPGVFVPRLRTGILVREALRVLPAAPRAGAASAAGTSHGSGPSRDPDVHSLLDSPAPVVLDLCCGAGAIGAAILAARPDTEVHAVDIDPAATKCARRTLDAVWSGRPSAPAEPASLAVTGGAAPGVAGLGGAGLGGADVGGVDVAGTGLPDADVGGADPGGAGLGGVGLAGTGLPDADVGGADPGRADVGGADSPGARRRDPASPKTVTLPRVYTGGLYAPLPASLRGRVDVIVANAPYVPTGDIRLMPLEAREHEALAALDGGSDGLDLQRRVAEGAAEWLAPGAHLIIETSRRQAAATAGILEAAGFSATIVRDGGVDGTAVVGAAAGAAAGRH